jgi:hypothetical protein
MYNAQFGNNYQECKCNDRENIGPLCIEFKNYYFYRKRNNLLKLKLAEAV